MLDQFTMTDIKIKIRTYGNKFIWTLVAEISQKIMHNVKFLQWFLLMTYLNILQLLSGQYSILI